MSNLRDPSRFYRSTAARGLRQAPADAPAIDRDGGAQGAGLIRGAAIITRGEALGHGSWVDPEMLQQAADGINGLARGAKVRFTHPSLSGDGLGNFLGRARGAEVHGDKVYADIHFSPAGHRTPDGDLASYVMDLAENDPEAFGVSIVYEPDYGAEARHEANHENADGHFQSPDPMNEKNLPHARIHKLRAADVVDDPAANPDGLFHREADLVDEAEALAAHAVGLTDDLPQLTRFDVDASRIRGFVARFLDANGLEIRPKLETNPMQTEPQAEAMQAEETPETTEPQTEPQAEPEAAPEGEPQAEATEPQAEPETPAESGEGEAAQQAAEPADDQQLAADPDRAAEGSRFIESFGPQGAVWYAEGRSYEEARELHAQAQAEEIEKLRKENAELQQAAADSRGGDPIEITDPTAAAKPQESAVKRSVKMPGSK